MAIFPLAPDQTIAQMWSNGVREAVTVMILEGTASWSLWDDLKVLAGRDIHG